MCGIMGYCGMSPAAPKVFEGLKKLEYRGYDSAGIATADGGRLHVFKKRGRVGELQAGLARLEGNIGVGHTRWATHGKPSDRNAHPHVAGKIAIVHNGIIENFRGLRAALENSGVKFSSDTDSEVIAHLISRNYKGDLLAAVHSSVKMLKGSYALMVICADFNGIIAACKKSPVIVGYGRDGIYCASDEPALAGVCRTVTVLGDGDLCVFDCENAHIYDKNLRPCARAITPNLAAPADLELDGAAHYMLKELREAPAAVKNTLLGFGSASAEAGRALRGAGKIILSGCGTAYHAALVGKRYFEELGRAYAEAEIAGEFRYKRPVVPENCVFIAVSQSGETADTVEAARLAASLGAVVIAVTNSPHSQLARLAQVTVPVCAGPEICVAATKSYSGQVCALYLLALVHAGKYDDMHLSSLADMPALCARNIKALEEDEGLNSLAHACAKARGVYFLGRDIDYALALEGSLKLKEVSYVPGGGFPSSELKHGTLALIDGRTVSVFLICDEELKDKCENAVRQVVARGGRAAVISPFDCNIAGVPQIRIAAGGGILNPLLAASALHVLAYRAAVILGRDPDKPRNLAKSVTVE